MSHPHRPFAAPAPRHVGTLCPRDVRLAEVRAAAIKTAANKSWAALSPTARLVLVMIGAEQRGDVEKIALQEWSSFSESDRLSMDVVRRKLGEEFSRGGALA